MKYDNEGLIPAIIQDDDSKEVVMLGYMNKESYELTIMTKRVWFYSRSRKKLWMKGETSKNILKVISIDLDCDKDTLLISVNPSGPTCHTGEISCFHNNVLGYKSIDYLKKLEHVIKSRIEQREEGSYTLKLMDSGLDRIVQKFGEEAVETIIAFKNSDKEKMVGEATDLMYHFLVMLFAKELSLSDINKELSVRAK
jgi:phosphoribosyl-ATP pyrophosphohydrolase/phosphoribosyl-AMP cyclohydrolase